MPAYDVASYIWGTLCSGAKRSREAIEAAGAGGSGGAKVAKGLLLNGMKICVQERSAPPSVAELKAGG
jgi:hypothetical protein